ncbi:MAG: DUF3800 domain-containing protein [Halopenitus sp.]
MKLGYIDESGTEGEEGWFIATAFIIDSNSWMEYDRLPNEIPQDVRTEIDYLKDLRHPQDGLDPDRQHQVSEEIYDRMSRIGFLTISIIVHQPAASNFCDPGDMYNMAFTLLAERFEYILEDENEVGVLFVDERDDRTPRELQQRHYELKRDGSVYANFNRTIGAAAPLRDNESVPMSLADWCSSAVRNHFIRGRPVYYSKIIDHVQRHPSSGEITGSGIKIVPDDRVEELQFHPDNTDFNV